MEDQDKADRRAQYIAGLRQLADVLEANPSVSTPYTGGHQAAELLIFADTANEFVEACARVGAEVVEVNSRPRGRVMFAGLHLAVYATDRVCAQLLSLDPPPPTPPLDLGPVRRRVEERARLAKPVEWPPAVPA